MFLQTETIPMFMGSPFSLKQHVLLSHASRIFIEIQTGRHSIEIRNIKGGSPHISRQIKRSEAIASIACLFTTIIEGWMTLNSNKGDIHDSHGQICTI
jgi:hypothetical protein